MHTPGQTGRAGLDAKQKLQEIAARDLGGSPESYDVEDGRVFRRGNRSQGMTFARAAERAHGARR